MKVGAMGTGVASFIIMGYACFNLYAAPLTTFADVSNNPVPGYRARQER